ncbi:MAG: metal-dependent hydrolase [Candidatus Thorarchaeota archaeon]
MNRLSHIMFAFALFVGLYTLIYAFTVFEDTAGSLTDLLFYYVTGGIAVSVVSVPILYWKAPNKDMHARTTSNRSAVSAMFFVAFCIGSLAGAVFYQLSTGIAVIGGISVFIGGVITVAGALMPDWDIPFLGISRHRNIIFHSVILPLLVILTTMINIATALANAGSIGDIGAKVEYYIAALYLLGYASHLYLDIFPSDSNPLEILWIAADPYHKAPTGLKPLGPIKISQKNARNWLVGNASLLVMIAIAFMGLYFINLP